MSKTIYDILTTDSVGSDTRDKHIFVVECSSFMLYPTKEYNFAIGLWTNFAPDHLNRHPSMDEYFAAKQQLVARSTQAFVNKVIMEKLSSPLREKSNVYPTTYDLSGTNFIGSHNARNCALAEVTVQKFCEMHDLIVTPDAIQQAIKTVLPLKHRMQPCQTIQGVTRYDDGKSTSAQSL
jgi:UDP-N-acetylmuramoylalanine--D-glutamate ligase